jgi:ligand-binding sensor domain-containing protein/serine phosphatase RsbU (regulator of sigma subunit)
MFLIKTVAPFLILFIVNMKAQTYSFRNYNEETGLNQAYIYSISQSPNGFLSMATGEGYTVFDGNKFTVFTNDEVADNFVTTHYVDSRNIPWLGHSQNGISYLKDGKFNHLTIPEIKSYKVTQISEDKYGNIWVATAGGGLFKVDAAFKISIINTAQLKNILSFIFDANGSLVCASPEGIFIFNVTNKSSNSPNHLIKEIEMFHNKSIKQVVSSKNHPNQFWAVVNDEGLYCVEKLNTNYKVISHINDELNLNNAAISCAFVDRANSLWVSLFGEGIRKVTFNGREEDAGLSIFKIDKSNGLKNLYVQSIFQDSEGNMWFGTFGAGLIEKPIEKFSFYGIVEGISHSDVSSILVQHNGNIWIGHQNGLGNYTPLKNAYKIYNGVSGFVNDKVTALVAKNDNQIYIGTEFSGLFIYDVAINKFTQLLSSVQLNQAQINCITKSSTNELLIGTTRGLHVLNNISGHLQTWTTAEGLLHNNVFNVFLDSKKRMWISSHGAPPYYIFNKEIVPFNNIDDLKLFNINGACEDKNGNIWLATEGDGVLKYDNKTFSLYKTNEGLLSNYCYGISCDEKGSIWATHHNGLSEKKEFHKEFQSNSLKDGLLFIDNNINAVFKDNMGDLWFGTRQGVVHYNSDASAVKASNPKVFIDKVVINDVRYSPLEKIKLEYGYYSVHIDYLAISLTNPEKIKYKYRLLGIDSLWKTTAVRNIDFPKLADGDYTFQLMACNMDGLWSSIPAQISFSITPPIWKRLWFYALIISLLISITYFTVFLRTKSLRNAQVILQRKIEEKTFLLQKEKEGVEVIKGQLETKNKDITDSINYAKRIQDSLLPSEEILNELFLNKYFILYKPKDIVSGDFYWAASTTTSTEQPKNFSLAAVADCTGHGVPGAFLSIVASNFLQQTVTEESVNNTSDALNYLNDNIRSNLNSGNKLKNRINDGMDISLIAIDYDSGVLYYSGANNPIYIYRKDADAETSLIILKPTKKAIGSGADDTKYQLQTFLLQKDDTIYLFSDGYPDQFGGVRDKKLNYRRFKEILSHAANLPIHSQKIFLDDKFISWLGSGEQTDDVCVMGIRI